MKVALMSAAVNGDNAGDALIEDAVCRLIVAQQYARFPLVDPLSDADIARINASDVLVICGTNLYQSRFACCLTEQVVRRIRVPIIPVGIGSSAPIGDIPVMDEEGTRTVQMIHDRCAVSSVRDRASLLFLRSIGVKNAVLTGCPVLFHSLRCPDFSPSGEGCTLTPRVRLLHIDQKWNARQQETLHVLCRRYKPTLVLQSPYDVPIAEELSHRYGVPLLYDKDWQAPPYVAQVAQQELNFGFRLHFGMLSLSYGKPAFFVAHDSRVSEFCELMGLRYFDIRESADNSLILDIDARCFPADRFRQKWSKMAGKMNVFLRENNLESRLCPDLYPAPGRSIRVKKPRRKPRILLLVDRPNWAFDHSARQIAKCLSKDFKFRTLYVKHSPKISPEKYDLVYVFFWGENYHKSFGLSSERTIKELSSWRWQDDPQYGPCTPGEVVQRYLLDAGTVVCTSERLFNQIQGLHPSVYYTPNGIDAKRFKPIRERSGSLTIGWAGNPHDPVKGLRDILKPACGRRFDLRVASGLSHRRMNDFYNALDVFAVTSKHEGEPLTLLEAMGAGCFPVCTDVGIAHELIRPGENGIIVNKRDPKEFRRAFEWCESHLDEVRAAGRRNAEFVRRERKWTVTAPYFKRAFLQAIAFAERPRFRNDDVSWDTPLDRFHEFCRIFRKYGLRQVHGVTLFGRTTTLYMYNDEAAEYEHVQNISRINNSQIRELSRGFRFAERRDLIDFLAHSRDEIALHGLYHVDHSKMSAAEQKHDIKKGVEILTKLFPNKSVKYFIPPFNRTNDATFSVCHEFGLEILGASDVHLEAELQDLKIESCRWYRYHHHRFYPESKFSYYNVSLAALDKALARNLSMQPVDLGCQPIGNGGNPFYRLCVERWSRLMLKIGGYRRINLYQIGSKIRRVGLVRFLSRRFIPLSWRGRIKRLFRATLKVVEFARGQNRSKKELRKKELRLPAELVEPILDQYQVKLWFKYIFRERASRWDVWQPCLWVAQNFSPKAQVLETGCGVGFNLMWLAEQEFQHLYGFDIDQRAVAAGTEICKKVELPVQLWVGDGLKPHWLPQERFSVILALNWTMYVPGFRLDQFIDSYLPYLAEDGALIFDVIDTSYNHVPNNQYLTSDWHKPVNQRQSSEYKVRISEEKVRHIVRSRGLKISKVLAKKQVVLRNVFVVKRYGDDKAEAW